MSKDLFLLLSGRFVGPELIAEFGPLPPSFLPNGTHRLYEDQVAFAKACTPRILMTLPTGFEVPRFDAEIIERAGVTVLSTDPERSIAEVVSEVLTKTGHNGRLFVLFGDTLIGASGASAVDTFAAGETRHLANWADFERDGAQTRFHARIQVSRPASETRNVVAGFFDFADAGLLLSCLQQTGDYLAALNLYAEQRDLAPVPAERWLDFGHLHTYHQSRCNELAARAFNQVTADGTYVRKAGTPHRKIHAEAEWYMALPRRFRPFIPHFIGVETEPDFAYEIEYLHLPILAELFTFGQLPPRLWASILDSCKTFLERCQKVRPAEHEVPVGYATRFFEDMIVGKTFKRLESFAAAVGLGLDSPWTLDGHPAQSLRQTAEGLIAAVRPTSLDDVVMWHGDFHFANIFYDFRAQRVRVVDPRGMLSDGMMTMYGDARYDISKLTHSTFGLYDLIIAHRYSLSYDGAYSIDLDFGVDGVRDEILQEYASMRIGTYGCADREMLSMVALLFLSMLPLHDNDRSRQMAMLANALRLTRLAEAA